MITIIVLYSFVVHGQEKTIKYNYHSYAKSKPARVTVKQSDFDSVDDERCRITVTRLGVTELRHDLEQQ